MAARFGLPAHVLRHWESAGLLSTGDPMDHAGLLKSHVAALEHRIAEARAAKELIEHALSCPLPFDACPHARARIDARIGARIS